MRRCIEGIQNARKDKEGLTKTNTCHSQLRAHALRGSTIALRSAESIEAFSLEMLPSLLESGLATDSCLIQSR